MKSCIPWRKSFKYLSEIDQFNIDFKEKKKELLYFLDQYGVSQRVNIFLPIDITENQLDIIFAIWDMQKYNIALCFNWSSIEDNEEVYNKVKEKDIPFFFYYFISEWDEIYEFIERGVSDIYVTNTLGFNLPAVHHVAVENGIKIRCFADISQYNWDDQEGFKGFYIRPEDIDLYSEYIDTLEFYENSEYPNRMNILYEVYYKDKKWVGDLREIVQGIKQRVPNYYIMDKSFSQTRLTCERKCLKGNSCKMCEQILELANTIEDNPDYDIYIKTHKEN